MAAIPLNALRTFEAVARNLSFSKGARDLNVSTAAVSSQIRALEERLNQKLFRRHGRQVSLTAAGRKLFPGVQRGMRELRQAVQRADADRSEGVVNISMMPSFLQKWLMPRLGGFQDEHPDLDLRISTDDAQVDFAVTDFHAAIRFGPGKWSDLNAQRLMGDFVIPVCSPRYLDKHGALDSVTDLENHDLLYVDSPVLESWFREAGEHGRHRHQRLLNDATAILLAAELGEGIALSRWSLVARDIAAGRLVRPLQLTVATDWSYFFISPSQHHEMPKIRSLYSWLKAQCNAFAAPDGGANENRAPLAGD